MKGERERVSDSHHSLPLSLSLSLALWLTIKGHLSFSRVEVMFSFYVEKQAFFFFNHHLFLSKDKADESGNRSDTHVYTLHFKQLVSENLS